MAKITLEEQPEFALLPVDSIVLLKIKEVMIREINGARPWEKLEFTFEITGVQASGDGTPVTAYESLMGQKIWGSVPFRLTDSQENKLRLWAEAILGMELGVGFELDTDYFVGRSVRGLTGQYDKKQKDSMGRPFKAHQVESLLPMGAVTPAPQAPVQQQMPQAPVAPAQVYATSPSYTEDPPF